MALLETSAPGILAPEEVGPLIIEPLRLRSVALRTSTVLQTVSPSMRFPIVVSDATAGWVAEGASITAADPDIDELIVTPSKIAALTSVSNELISDSAANATASGVVADGLVRKFARTVDSAFYGNTVTYGPSGLQSIDYQTVDVSQFTNLDAFAEAISLLESVGVVCTSFAASFTTCLELALLKEFEATAEIISNRPLLASTPGQRPKPDRANHFRRPAVCGTGSTIEDGVVWAFGNEKVFCVMREDISVIATPFGPGFGADSVTIRGTMRLGFGFPQQDAVVKITAASS